MKRRDFIKMASAAGAALATGTAEPAEAKVLSPSEMDDLLARLDQHLDGISRRKTVNDLMPGLAPPRTDEERAVLARGDRLFRQSVRSLLLVGVLHDLPEASRQHGGVQQRLRHALPEMDDAVFGTLELIGDLTPADRLDIAAAIEKDPDLPMRVVEALDREGASLGISAKRRLHLRTLGAQVAWRMRSQSYSTVIDEYKDKTERVIAQHAAHPELLERMASLVPPDARRLASSEAGDPALGYTPPRSASPRAEVLRARERAQKGIRVVNAGAIVLGVGFGVGLTAGVLTLAVSFWFIFAVTVGALLILAGLITMLVGAIIRASADRDLERL